MSVGLLKMKDLFLKSKNESQCPANSRAIDKLMHFTFKVLCNKIIVHEIKSCIISNSLRL